MFLSFSFASYTICHYFILPFYLFLMFLLLLFLNKKNYNLNKNNVVFSFDEFLKSFFIVIILLFIIINFYNSFNVSIFFNHLSLKPNLLNLHKFIVLATACYFYIFFRNISNINLTLFDIFKAKSNYFI